MIVSSKNNDLIYGLKNHELKIKLSLKSIDDDSIDLYGEVISDQKVRIY